MEVGSEQELYVALIVYGGIILAGLLVTAVLLAFGVALWRKVKTGNEIKKLYEQERKNGQGGAKGHY